jgi:ParB-like chromosome segregation protein Spo0J
MMITAWALTVRLAEFARDHDSALRSDRVGFVAFKKLADDGKGPEEIAARFGTTAKIVAQRLKLAVVSPKLIALYRKDEMTLDCLMAFTVCDQHKQQEKVWAALPDWARERPGHIREALTEKHVAADSKLAQFVGLAAYEAQASRPTARSRRTRPCSTASMKFRSGSPNCRRARRPGPTRRRRMPVR